MKITFGLRLDGEHGWRPANRLGMPVLGPLGLLNLLETRLGLLRAECTQAQRVTQYPECLKSCDTPDRFYHASFGIDPIGASASTSAAVILPEEGNLNQELVKQGQCWGSGLLDYRCPLCTLAHVSNLGHTGKVKPIIFHPITLKWIREIILGQQRLKEVLHGND